MHELLVVTWAKWILFTPTHVCACAVKHESGNILFNIDCRLDLFRNERRKKNEKMRMRNSFDTSSLSHRTTPKSNFNFIFPIISNKQIHVCAHFEYNRKFANNYEFLALSSRQRSMCFHAIYPNATLLSAVDRIDRLISNVISLLSFRHFAWSTLLNALFWLPLFEQRRHQTIFYNVRILTTAPQQPFSKQFNIMYSQCEMPKVFRHFGWTVWCSLCFCGRIKAISSNNNKIAAFIVELVKWFCPRNTYVIRVISVSV